MRVSTIRAMRAARWIAPLTLFLLSLTARADELAFANEPLITGAGAAAGPLQVVRTDSAGNPVGAGRSQITVRLVSDSARGEFSLAPSPTGAWSKTIDVSVPAESALAPPVFYRDGVVGSPRVVASSPGMVSRVQLQRITPFSFHEDFESPALLVNDGGTFHEVAGPASFAVTPDAAHRGDGGLHIEDRSTDAGFEHGQLMYLSSPVASSDLHARAWVRLTNTASTAGVVVLAVWTGANGQTIGDIILRFPGARVGTQGHDSSGLFAEAPGTKTLGDGTWHLLDLIIEGVGGPNASRRVYVDGELSAEQMPVDLTGMSFAALKVGPLYVKDGVYNGDLDLDDVRVAAVKQATRLRIDAPDVDVVAGTCVPIAMGLESPDGQPGFLPSLGVTRVTATGADAGVFLDGDCLMPTADVTFDALSASTTFFVSARAPGALSLSASMADVLPGTATFDVVAAPNPGGLPTARVVLSATNVDPGESVRLDATSSTAGPDATLTRFRWSLVRGPSGITFAEGPVQEVSFEEPGRYVFRLVVEDSVGRVSPPVGAELRVRGEPWAPPRALGCSAADGHAGLAVLGFAVLVTLCRRRPRRRPCAPHHALRDPRAR